VRGGEASVYAERRKDVGCCLCESTGEKASVVTDDEKLMALRMTRPKGCSDGAGNQSNALNGKIPGDDSAPSICPKADLWRRGHQWVESGDSIPIVIIA
jgi:hypothetical protein